MISDNEMCLLKKDTDFYLYCYDSLNKIKDKTEVLNKESNCIKEKIIIDIDELITSSDKLKIKIENFFSIKKTLNKFAKKEEINSIKEVFKTLYDNMILICENSHINKIKKLKNELNDIMIGLSDPEFDPPNVNSFNISLNQENEFENTNSVISMSILNKNESIQGEILSGFNDYVDNYNSNNNSRDIISNNNTNNNNTKKIKIDSFEIFEMNKNINNSNNNILKDKIIDSHINKYEFSVDNFFYSDDDITDVEEINKKNVTNEFSNNCNQFYYIISLITKGKNISINKDNIKLLFFNNLKEKLNIKENNIFLSFDNYKNFIESYIKTKEFSDSYINIIKRDYPDFNKLLEYKMIYEDIKKINKSYFDYNGNTISPNSSFNNLRGKEEYDPPYGWFGIGLNISKYGNNKDWIENKTNTSKWAIAYHGVGQFLSNDKVKAKIIDIISKNSLVPTKKQKYKDSKDKRNPGKKIGEGIYLTPKIKMAENFAGIININNKKYKVLLMARVLIEKIREPEELEYWILNKDEIRFYRILVKEINSL